MHINQTPMKRWFLGCFFVFLQAWPWVCLAFSPYSNQELDALEKKFVELINEASSVERNPLTNQYINHLGKRLAYFSPDTPVTFFIVRSQEINAFAGPGGYIGINTQLILATNSESELAAVMAHEMAHVRLHHLYQALEHKKQMQAPMLASLLAALALGILNPALGNGALMASLGGFAQDNINFIRSNEKEADRIGIDMLIKSGFNPESMSAFFKKMQESMRYYYTANVPAILRTHPLDDDRIAEAENRTAHLPKKTYVSSQDYFLFKEYIRVLSASNYQSLAEHYEQQFKQKTCNSTCQYGYALLLSNANQFQPAQARMEALISQEPNNLYYQLQLSHIEQNIGQFKKSVQRMKELYTNYPQNYAIIMEYASSLMAASEAEKATAILLKGSRRFKNDLPLCKAQARAQATSGQKDYAYFTEARCQLLQGHQREALSRLKQAKLLTAKNPYLSARINAMIEEIQFSSQNN